MGNAVFTQVQVKAGVQYVQPRCATHVDRFNTFDRAGVNLDAATTADKHHNGSAIERSLVQHVAHSARLHAVGKTSLNQAETLLPLHSVMAQQTKKFMGILHGSPVGYQCFGITLSVQLGGCFDASRGKAVHCARLSKVCGYRLPSFQISGLTLEYLVHRLAVLIKKLQADVGPVARIGGQLGDGITGMPLV